MKKKKKDRRTVQIWTRVSTKEKTVIDREAKRKFLNLSDYIRQTLLSMSRIYSQRGKPWTKL